MAEIEGNPFNPLVPDTGDQTPTWSRLIQTAIEAALMDVHTWLPATVVLVRQNNMVDIQPLLMRKFKTLPAAIPLPIVQNTMVCAPRGSTWGMKLPIVPGDFGVALFCERSLDLWSVSGGLVDPQDARHHDLSDAVFIPGLYPESMPILPPMGAMPTDMVFYNALAQIYLQAEGTFKITNGPAELMLLLNQILGQVTAIATQLNTFATTMSTAASIPGVTGGPLTSDVAVVAQLPEIAAIVAALVPLSTALATLQGV
jgi:hypothetical protein